MFAGRDALHCKEPPGARRRAQRNGVETRNILQHVSHCGEGRNARGRRARGRVRDCLEFKVGGGRNRGRVLLARNPSETDNANLVLRHPCDSRAARRLRGNRWKT